jgi:hypothetical protein
MGNYVITVFLSFQGCLVVPLGQTALVSLNRFIHYSGKSFFIYRTVLHIRAAFLDNAEDTVGTAWPVLQYIV